MLDLPSGRRVMVSARRLRFHLARKGGAVDTRGKPLAALAPLLDVLEARPNGHPPRRGRSLASLLHELRERDGRDYHALRAALSAERGRDFLGRALDDLRNAPAPARLVVTPGTGRFYSLLRRRIVGLWLRRAPAAQWLATIENFRRTGISEEEIHWSGLRRWLAARERVVGVRAVLRAAAFDTVTPEVCHEVLPRRRMAPCFAPAWIALGRGECGFAMRPPGRVTVRFVDRNFGYRVVHVEPCDLFREHDQWRLLDGDGRDVPPRRVARGPAGGYASAETAMRHAAAHLEARWPRAGGAAHMASYAGLTVPGGFDYREWLLVLPWWHDRVASPHFGTENVVAHLRTKRRVDAAGRMFLFVEEVQSDWHQGGAARAGRAQVPFRRTWHELALRVAAREAAVAGLAGIAWTSGDQQAERYPESDPAWLRRLYDRSLPRYASRFARRWGVAPEPLRLDVPYGADRNLGLVFSPDMALEIRRRGVPLFGSPRVGRRA